MDITSQGTKITFKNRRDSDPGPVLRVRTAAVGRGNRRGSLTCRGGRAGAPVLAVVPALFDLTRLPAVVGLAATFGLLAGIEEAAAPIQTLHCAGSGGRGCGAREREFNIWLVWRGGG